jgi:hypothetical protein
MVMNSFHATAPIHDALDIAIAYFASSGHRSWELNRNLADHIIELFNKGERRPLMLANRAIEAIEREVQVEQELHEASMIASFRKRG